jgi:hypothetical protein
MKKMTLTARTQNLLDHLKSLMTVNEDEIVQRGIAQATTERIIDLRRRAGQFSETYESVANLEALANAGVSADDHTLYTDLLEWRAIQHELESLAHFLETV